MMPPYPTYPSGWYSHPNHFPPNSNNYSQKGLKSYYSYQLTYHELMTQKL